MTDRLYYTIRIPESTRRFSAVTPWEPRRQRLGAARSDNLYPTSGGQPCDIGTLGPHPS